jgi:hypothetical protein
MKEQIRAIRTELKESINESKQFHVSLLDKLEHLGNRSEQLVRLSEKVKVLERLVWGTLTFSIGAVVKIIFDLVGQR